MKAAMTVVKVDLCEPGGAPCSSCRESFVKDKACVLPMAPSGLALPARFVCDNTRSNVNVTFYDSIRGVCDTKAPQRGGLHAQRTCIGGPTLSYAIECVTAAGALLAPPPAVCDDGRLMPSCIHALGATRPRASKWLHEREPQLASADDVPSQMHLALGAAPGTMTLTWITRNECPASAVWWRGHRVAASSTTYSVPKRWWQPTVMRWVHTATLDGLESRAEFSYVLGDNVTTGCKVLPMPIAARAPPTRGTLPISTAMMADVGSINVLGFATWAALDSRSQPGERLDIDLVVHAGDVSYAGMDVAVRALNVTRTDEWEPLWDLYGVAHEAVTRRRAYMVGIGNHEAWYNWTAVSHRYPMTQSSPSELAALARPPFWYSFVSGGVHWTMLSSEHDYAAGSDQYAFAAAALAAVDRTLTPWSVVAFHRPMYCTEAGEYSTSRPGGRLQRELEPLLLAHDVDLVVNGHQHGYERIHPNVAGNVTARLTPLPGGDHGYVRPAAPVYLMVGHGGAAQDETWVTPPPEWSAVRFSQGCDFTGGHRRCGGSHGGSWEYTDTFGWMHAEFVNRTHVQLHTEMVSGSLGDEFWLVRDDK